MTTTVSQEARKAEVTHDGWRGIAASAARHGIRYRTNTALMQFLCDIAPYYRQSAEHGEVVAWLYERKGFAPAVSMRDPRLRYSDIETLFPLYTLPTPPEAVRTPIEGTSHAD